MSSWLQAQSVRGQHDCKERIVYVVDDDEPMRTAMEGLLRSSGVPVASFESLHDFLAHPRHNVPSA